MPNTIIKASAGSGKTFQLSNEFLRIVLRTGTGRTSEKAGSILASTFTRKAAGEILDRILNRLAEAALDPAKQEQFAQYVPLPVKDKTKRTKLLQETTAEIAKNLYRLRISTLDSFFNKIASSFALELALPPGWSIIEETEYQRSIHEAVHEVFEKSQNNEAKKLLHLLQKGEQDRSVTQEVVNLAKDLLPLVRSTDAVLWNHEDADKLGTLTVGKMTDEMIRAHAGPYREDIDLRQSILPRNAPKRKNEEAPLDSRFVSAMDDFLGFVNAQDWKTLLSKGLGKNVSQGLEKFQGKTMEPPLLNFLTPLVRHAQAVLMETIINQTKATRLLLDLVWEKLEAVLLQKQGFRFEDITFLLGESFRQGGDTMPQQLLSYRMDAPTEHLLLDEFQDTSLPQWNILKPFVEPVIAHERKTFFCVGDLKQAIYSWRGGVAEIFETVNDFIAEEGADSPDTPVMNETRRNAQPVIETVNQVFLNIGTNAAVCDKSPVAAAKWQHWFGNHPHKTTEERKGYCVLEAVPHEETTDGGGDDSEPEDMENPFWKYTLDRIEQLHRKHPARSIGILFRNKKDIPTVLKGLKTRNVEASDEGGVPLTDSAAVQQILSVMTLLDHPGDTIVRFHLAGGLHGGGPLAELLPLKNFDDDVEAEKTALRWREKLLSQGYGKTVKELMSALTPCEPKEMQRLEKLLELAYRFDEQATGTRTRQFIESVKAARQASPGAAAVRVMTIHGAKGLEFDIVVLPDLNRNLVGQAPKMVVSQDSPAAPVNFVLRWVDKDLRPLLPEKPYRDAFVQWQDNQVKESLAVLYVAMTRARYALVMLVPEKSRKGTYAAVLQAGLEGNLAAAPCAAMVYQNGDADWDDAIQTAGRELPPLVWNALAHKPLLRNLPRESPSSMEGKDGRRQTADGNLQTADGGRQTAALRGTAIHACFASVRWLGETHLAGTPADKQYSADTPVQKTLQKIVEQSLAGKRNDLDSSEIVKEFLAMCEQPEVRKILMRSSYPAAEEIDVELERRFAVRWKGKLLHGSMDRLVIRRLKGEVIGLDIIDFKTDSCPVGESVSDFLAERKRIYKPQMEAYCRAVERLYPNVYVRNITLRLVFTSVDRVEVLE